MKPSLAALTSGPEPSACTPLGRKALADARSAAVPATLFNKSRREIEVRDRLVVISFSIA
jgi:hypothetical protein